MVPLTIAVPVVYLMGLMTSILAQEGSQDFSFWVQWGVLGVILALIMFKKIAPGWVVDDKDEIIKSQSEQLKELNGKMLEVVVVLSEATKALQAMKEDQ